MMLLGGASCALAVHEAGHLVAGRIMGFRFGFFAIGPVWLAREGASIRLRWNRLPAAWGGMALAYPTDTRALAARMAFYAAGGPLASLALSVVAFWVGNSIPALTSLSRWAMVLALMSACVLVATVQPFGTGIGVRSDGGKVLLFAANRVKAKEEAAVVALMGLAAAGVRPREWSAELVRTAGAIRSPAALALGAMTLVLRHRLDQGNRLQAEAAVDALLGMYDASPALVRGDAAAEVAFYLAFFRRDVVEAKKFLKDAEPALTEQHRIFRADAAVRLRSSDAAGATRALRKAQAALEHALVEVTDLDRDLVAAVGNELVDAKGSAELKGSLVIQDEVAR